MVRLRQRNVRVGGGILGLCRTLRTKYGGLAGCTLQRCNQSSFTAPRLNFQHSHGPNVPTTMRTDYDSCCFQPSTTMTPKPTRTAPTALSSSWAISRERSQHYRRSSPPKPEHDSVERSASTQQPHGRNEPLLQALEFSGSPQSLPIPISAHASSGFIT
jgi:hypothetical protein